MKAIEQYFHVVLFIMLYKVVLTKSVDETLVCDHSNESSEQYFHVVLLIVLFKMVLTFISAVETLVWDHSNESYRVITSCGTVYYVVQDGSHFGMSMDETLVCDRSNESY